jgi:hypothetical protein
MVNLLDRIEDTLVEQDEHFFTLTLEGDFSESCADYLGTPSQTGLKFTMHSSTTKDLYNQLKFFYG